MKHVQKIILFIIGTVLVITGIAGLVLPFIPGWVLIFVGISFMEPEFAEKLKQWLHRKFSKRGIICFERKALGPSPAHSGFTTKHFPIFLKKTDDLLKAENQQLFQKLLSENLVARSHGFALASKFVFLDQAHGGNIVILEEENDFKRDGFYRFLNADGVMTRIKGVMLLAMSADCLTVFFKARDWVGLVHAGWRGTREQIVKKMFLRVSEKAGCKPQEVGVSFGPCIRRDSYEVGTEFKTFFPKRSFREKGGKIYFDLAAENKRQLVEAGADREIMRDWGIDTFSESRDFHSFRKEKEAADRMISFIMRTSL